MNIKNITRYNNFPSLNTQQRHKTSRSLLISADAASAPFHQLFTPRETAFLLYYSQNDPINITKARQYNHTKHVTDPFDLKGIEKCKPIRSNTVTMNEDSRREKMWTNVILKHGVATVMPLLSMNCTFLTRLRLFLFLNLSLIHFTTTL